MKLLSFLASVTLLASAAFWTAIACDTSAVSLFALTISLSVLLLAVHDYYPRRRLLNLSSTRRVQHRRAKYVLPMAV